MHISIRRGRRAALVLAAAVAATVPALAVPAQAAPPAKIAVIVQLTPGSDAAAEARAAAANGGVSVSFVYRNALRGFAGQFTEAAMNGLRHNPHVALIEADGVATTSGTQANPPSWGLDRIDQRSRPLDQTYAYASTGTGVTAYIIDTGINPSTADLTGRIGPGVDKVDNDGNPADCNGHGTHVAGTVGGATYGVAKGVTVVPVRVLDCGGSGSWSGVIAGLDWVVGDHGPNELAVANMSLGGSRNSSVDAAVKRVIDAGVTVAVAAGNSHVDACNSSPARVAQAVTVGATDTADRRASFSNFGTCLDLFAPGVNITSDWLGSGTATNTISGTSMATPHVTGAAALVLGRNPSFSPTDVAATLATNSTKNVVGSAGKGSLNRLLYSPPA